MPGGSLPTWLAPGRCTLEQTPLIRSAGLGVRKTHQRGPGTGKSAWERHGLPGSAVPTRGPGAVVPSAARIHRPRQRRGRGRRALPMGWTAGALRAVRRCRSRPGRARGPLVRVTATPAAAHPARLRLAAAAPTIGRRGRPGLRWGGVGAPRAASARGARTAMSDPCEAPPSGARWSGYGALRTQAKIGRAGAPLAAMVRMCACTSIARATH